MSRRSWPQRHLCPPQGLWGIFLQVDFGKWKLGKEGQAWPLRSWPGLGPVVEWRMVDPKAEVTQGPCLSLSLLGSFWPSRGNSRPAQGVMASGPLVYRQGSEARRDSNS